MDFRSERVVLDNSAVLEIATIVREGHKFTARGSLVDEAGGLILGYVSQDGKSLTTWEGKRICGLRMVSKFKAFGHTVFAYQAAIGGRRWHGRGSGPEMLLRLRCRRQAVRQ
jgi:hypothetical protein